MTCDSLQTTAQILTGLGLLSGFVASLLMANAYFQATGWGLSIWVVISSLWRGAKARGAARMREANPENVLNSLQGVALLGLSFLLQLGAFVAQLRFDAICRQVSP